MSQLQSDPRLGFERALQTSCAYRMYILKHFEQLEHTPSRLFGRLSSAATFRSDSQPARKKEKKSHYFCFTLRKGNK